MTFCPCRIVSAIGSVNSAFCSNLVPSFWKSVQLVVCLLEFCPYWESGNMTFCPSRIVFTMDTINSGFCSRLALSSWESVQLEGCLLEFCLSWESGHMTVWPRRIVSTIGYVNFGFCSCLGLSSWEFVHLDVCLFGFCPHGNLCTWYSVNSGLCQRLVVSTLDSAPSWFCLLVIMFMKEYFYLRPCTLGILFTFVFDSLDSVHLGVCPYDSQSTKFCARDKVFQISSGSPLVLSLFKSV